MALTSTFVFGNAPSLDTALTLASLPASPARSALSVARVGASAIRSGGLSAIRNGHVAGGRHPRTGVPFDRNGFPDFSGVLQRTVSIQQTGNRSADVRAANRAAGFGETPAGYTWRNHQDGRTMQLVPTSIHSATGHTGGVALGGGGR